MKSLLNVGTLLSLTFALGITACGHKEKSGSKYPANFNSIGDAGRVDYMIAHTSPDSVARFIIQSALGKNPDARIDTLAIATNHAYEKLSGNGGGFVFDCRAVHNPGRYDCYKPLTGLDVPVREFLEKDGEMLRFLESCYRLVDASVERYMERGFTSLTVSFGCTGGRHRSVYGAQAMAGHIWDRYGVRVELVHRERGITEVFEPR